MKNQLQHMDDAALNQLVFGDEESEEYRATAAHVETCAECQTRLSQLATSAEFDSDVNELLGSDPRVDCLKPSGADLERLDFLSPPSHPEMLGRLGRYEIERVIGSGGMGIVLKAFDTELNRPVAIKVLAQHLAHSGAARQRFTREAKAAAAVVHEHVVAIHNVEADRDVPFLVMQYVAGESLQARVDREGPLDPKEILRIGIQAASGLAAAHAQGVIHRDVKPANILLENGVERVLLTDFGLARTVDDASLTHTGVVAGTPHYMSPEQANGEASDHRTDLFSLGSVLYFMATGHPPFRAERAMGVLHRICHDTHRPVWQVNSDVPDELSILIDKLLEKRPARRMESADAIQARMTSLLAAIQQPPSGFRRHLRRMALRYPRRTLTALALVAVFSIAATWMAWNGPNTPKPGVNSAAVEEISSDTGRPPVSPLFDFQESSAFQSNMAALNSRLTGLAAGGAFLAPTDHDYESTLQSLHQRLDRLQGDNTAESQDDSLGEMK